MTLNTNSQTPYRPIQVLCQHLSLVCQRKLDLFQKCAHMIAMIVPHQESVLGLVGFVAFLGGCLESDWLPFGARCDSRITSVDLSWIYPFEVVWGAFGQSRWLCHFRDSVTETFRTSIMNHKFRVCISQHLFLKYVCPFLPVFRQPHVSPKP